MSNIKPGTWGLRVLALVLAVVIYLALKNGSSEANNNLNSHRTNDKGFLQSR